MGEPDDEKTIIQNILRTLPGRFNPKVSVLEYSENIEKVRKEELHGVLIAYEMRLDEEKGTLHLETVFVSSQKTNKDKQPSIEMTCTCKCEEKVDDGEGLSDEDYTYFTRKLKPGKGKFKGKLPLIFFGCGDVGHFVEKCPDKSYGNSNRKERL